MTSANEFKRVIMITQKSEKYINKIKIFMHNIDGIFFWDMEILKNSLTEIYKYDQFNMQIENTMEIFNHNTWWGRWKTSQAIR